MADKPIYSKESTELEKLYSKLIGRHNMLCSIEKTFEENKTLSNFFEQIKLRILPPL